MFTSGYVNTEIILHFFYKITNERGTKTVFTYTHVKWFYGQSEHAYYLNFFYNVLLLQGGNVLVPHGSLRVNLLILRGGGGRES